MNYISVNDFVGEINLDLSNDSNVIANFSAIATQVETDILRDLLNDKLYSDLIDNTTSGSPTDSAFIDLVNGTTYTNLIGKTIVYEGLKRMIRYFVYDAYLDIIYSQNTGIGQMQSQNENSTPLTRGALRKVRARIQNKAVGLYKAAAIFINDNYTDYFSATDYAFWRPAPKKYLGKITSQTYSNNYFYNKSSTEN